MQGGAAVSPARRPVRVSHPPPEVPSALLEAVYGTRDVYLARPVMIRTGARPRRTQQWERAREQGSPSTPH